MHFGGLVVFQTFTPSARKFLLHVLKLVIGVLLLLEVRCQDMIPHLTMAQVKLTAFFVSSGRVGRPETSSIFSAVEAKWSWSCPNTVDNKFLLRILALVTPARLSPYKLMCYF